MEQFIKYLNLKTMPIQLSNSNKKIIIFSCQPVNQNSNKIRGRTFMIEYMGVEDFLLKSKKISYPLFFVPEIFKPLIISKNIFTPLKFF